ncbi:MAG: ABC transporter ATP-binding protein [Betaproteobacteria bacterium RIFCSPLOWO2_12_FULL_65_14]|nr:MAG: ABC transporter ATP-binding protein [Betaproteobacteria bacterium RIFCSPLOWO2_12_FULL_65_14]
MIEVTGLESRYGRIPALKGIELSVRAGELVALVGANGAGKSTLLRALSGVQPASGKIVFEETEIQTLPPEQRVALGIVQVPEGRQVFAPLSVEDNLRLGAYRRGRAGARGSLERVYGMFPVLAERRRHAAGTLSGGQQQMLAIGRALMGQPRLLLLDEPSMGLAPRLVAEIFACVRALRAADTALLLVEQNARAALAIADRGYVLETGRIVLAGTGAQLLADESVRAAYLGL